jgi:ATP-binding cassette subfamily B protein
MKTVDPANGAEGEDVVELGWDAADREMRAATVRQISARLPGLLREAFRLAWRADGRAVMVLLVCQAATGALQAGGLLATTRAITVLIGSGDITGRLHTALPSLLLLAGASSARALFGLVVAWMSRRVAPQLSAQAHAMLLQAVASSELMAFEYPGFGDRCDAAERGANSAEDLVSGTQDLIASTASLIAAGLVISVLHPLLLPLLALGIVPRWMSLIRAQHVEHTSYRQSISDRRMMGALGWYLSDKYPADQIRAGTMTGFLLSRYRHHAQLVHDRERRAAWQSAKIAAVGSAVAGLTSLLLWGALVILLATGHMSLARAGTAVLALQTVSAALWGMVVAAGRLFRTSTYMNSWKSFLEETAEHRLARGTAQISQAGVFRAEKISLTYPDAQRPALDEVTFEVRRGEIVGLVGMNGSGKTTLSKCLAGLYLPDSGQVAWDGVDVRELDPADAWRLVSYVPQSYAKFPVTLEANITLGQPHEGGRAAVLAAAKAAGADRVIAKLRRGLDTLMARAFWGGSGDLSGGEWQRIALSRAFYRTSDLLVMDEPTSALDAEGEHRIITGLREQSQGRATVLVTHRLTCLRHVDRIVVLKDGRVVEQGTLDELLALGEGGELALLWSLQQEGSSQTLPEQAAATGQRPGTALGSPRPPVPAPRRAAPVTDPAPAVAVAVNALVRDEQGRVLLVDHGGERGWDLPGGLLADEGPAAGVLRTVRQDLAADDAAVGRLLAIDTVAAHVHGRTMVVHLYAVHLGRPVDPEAPRPGGVPMARFWPVDQAVEVLAAGARARLLAAVDAERGAYTAVLEDGSGRPAR